MENRLCVICAMPCRRHLCKKHLKSYVFDKRYGVFKLRPRLKVSQGQIDLFKNVRAIYKTPTLQEVTFNWMPYSRYDIAVMDRKLIIEFDGQQHYTFNKLFHKSKRGFQEYLEKDKKKEEIASMYGYKVIRFSFIEKVDDRDYVRKAMLLKIEKNKEGYND